MVAMVLLASLCGAAEVEVPQGVRVGLGAQVPTSGVGALAAGGFLQLRLGKAFAVEPVFAWQNKRDDWIRQDGDADGLLESNRSEVLSGPVLEFGGNLRVFLGGTEAEFALLAGSSYTRWTHAGTKEDGGLETNELEQEVYVAEINDYVELDVDLDVRVGFGVQRWLTSDLVVGADLFANVVEIDRHEEWETITETQGVDYSRRDRSGFGFTPGVALRFIVFL